MNIQNQFRMAALSIAAATLGLLLAAPGTASLHNNTSTGITLAGGPLAMHGYDAVAYFTENRAVLGRAVFSVAHDGSTFRFSSEANKKKFAQDPDRYVPQYGGFCAFGVSVSAKFDGDPRLFKVVDGKLYFNLNEDIQKQWLEDVPGNIRKADANWKQIRDKSPQQLK